jgi:small subunit ribosomal protein S17
MSQAAVESRQRVREGVVLSNKMQKTIVVEITRLIEHPQFKKVVKSKVKYAVHDEKNEAKIGDKVRIIETRPLSKNKRWRLVKVL